MKKYFLPIILLLILFDRSFVRSQSLVFPLIVHDNVGGIDTLRFGYKDWATYCIDPAYGESELDPQPPWYVFDARFIDSRSHVCLGQGLSLNLHEFDYFPGNDTFLVRFSSDTSNYPMTFVWDQSLCTSRFAAKMVFPRIDSDSLIMVNMNPVNSYQLANSEIHLVFIYLQDTAARTDALPLLATLSADSIKQHTSVLHCSQHGAQTYEGWFEWGINIAYGNKSLKMLTTDTIFSLSLSGLSPSTTYHYRARAKNYNGAVTGTDQTFTTLPLLGVKPDDPMPAQFGIDQNYPNPFNPSTNFEYRIANFGFVTLNVYNILGEKVATIVSKRLSPGTYSASWDAGSLPGGLYYYRLTEGTNVAVKKMVLMK